MADYVLSSAPDSIAYGYLSANLTRELIRRIRAHLFMQTRQVRPLPIELNNATPMDLRTRA